jgi:hypothetical protein
VADEQYDTPSGNPPASPAAVVYKAVAVALREASDGAFARLEVYGQLSSEERDRALSKDADHLRDLRYFVGEVEQLLRALEGFRSDREVRRVIVRASPAKRAAVLMGALAAVITALAAAWSAIAGKGKP